MCGYACTHFLIYYLGLVALGNLLVYMHLYDLVVLLLLPRIQQFLRLLPQITCMWDVLHGLHALV